MKDDSKNSKNEPRLQERKGHIPILKRLTFKLKRYLGTYFPEEMGLKRELSIDVICYKELKSETELSNSTVYFKLPLIFGYGDDKAMRFHYFKIGRLGTVIEVDLESGCASPANLNSAKRGRAVRLAENTQLPLKTRKYKIDESTGELQLMLDESQVW